MAIELGRYAPARINGTPAVIFEGFDGSRKQYSSLNSLLGILRTDGWPNPHVKQERRAYCSCPSIDCRWETILSKD